MKDKVHDELKRHFRPEFLNRIDDVIVFHQLSTDEITEIVDLLIKRVVGQLESQGLGFELKPAAKLLLATKGYDAALGARPLRRAIQRHGRRPAVGEDPVEGVPRGRHDRGRRGGRRDRLPHRRRCPGAGRAAAARRARGLRSAPE